MERRMPMIINDLDRLQILTDVKEKRLKQSKRARKLGSSGDYYEDLGSIGSINKQ